MNENRENLAESQHNFLVHFNSETTGPIFTIFLHDVQQLVELLMHISHITCRWQYIWVQAGEYDEWSVLRSNEGTVTTITVSNVSYQHGRVHL